MSQKIGERAGKYFNNMSGRFGDALDKADGQNVCSERAYQEDGQKTVHQFRRQIHKQADESQCPDCARDCRLRFMKRHKGFNDQC